MTTGEAPRESRISSAQHIPLIAKSAEAEVDPKDLEAALKKRESIFRTVPITIRLTQEDVAKAYRDWYKDQVSKDKRDELGRFLFGVSSASIGILLALERFSPPGQTARAPLPWLLLSGVLFLLTGILSLYLAVPKNQQMDPAELDLVALQRANANEMTKFAQLWFVLWAFGIVSAAVAISRN